MGNNSVNTVDRVMILASALPLAASISVSSFAGGRVVQRYWVNFQCRGVLLIWIIVGQGPFALAVGAVGVFGNFFSDLSFLFSFSLSLGDGPI